MNLVDRLEAMIFKTSVPESLSVRQLEEMSQAFQQPRSRSQIRALCDDIERLMLRLAEHLEHAYEVLPQVNSLVERIQFACEDAAKDPQRRAEAMVGAHRRAPVQKNSIKGMSLLSLRASG